MNTNRLLSIAVFVLLCLLSGCASLESLSRAQEAFSKGALMENNTVLQELSTTQTALPLTIGSSALSQPSPTLYYNLAYAEIQEALKKESKLSENGVLPNALALKALCEWKLKAYDQASNTARQARTAFAAASVEMPRDEAVMIALDGLIAAELAYTNLGTLKKRARELDSKPMDTMGALRFFEEVKEHYQTNIGAKNNNGRVRDALRILDNARGSIAPSHELQTWLVLAELSSLKTWLDELSLMNELLKKFGYNRPDHELQRWISIEQEQYRLKKDVYLDLLEKQLLQGKQHPLYQQWEPILFI